jgi:ribonuclease HI
MAKKKKFYAVRVGRKPGIYTEWFGRNGAEDQVKGFHNAIFKGFATREDAEGFLIDDIKSNSVEKSKRTMRKNSCSNRNSIIIYTDGGCINNPGPGRYGVVILNGKSRKELSVGYRLTTNNRMELMACIVGLQSLKVPSSVIVHSDSKYVVDGISKGWARNWQANNWMRNDTDRARNIDLWEQLLALCEKHKAEFVWIKGHAGIPENERCDELANKASVQKDPLIDNVYGNSVG